MDQAQDQFGTADDASDEPLGGPDASVPAEGEEREEASPPLGEGTSGEPTYDVPTGDDVSAPAEAPPADWEADEPVENDSLAEVLAGEPDAGEPASDEPAALVKSAVEEAELTEPAAEAVVEAEEPAEAEEPEKPERKPAAAAAPRVESGDGAHDPFGGPGDWYVVHTYAGYENKVKANLLSRIHSMQMEDKIFAVHIPMEDVLEIKGGKRQIVQRKVFPGYLLVKMFYDNDSWYVVRNTPGVTGFVSSGTGTKPTPLSKREVEKILAVKQETEAKPTFRLEFEEGDTVRIISGPFAEFQGTISEINVDQSKLKVLVNIFDRETPVELGFDQVAKQ